MMSYEREAIVTIEEGKYRGIGNANGPVPTQQPEPANVPADRIETLEIPAERALALRRLRAQIAAGQYQANYALIARRLVPALLQLRASHPTAVTASFPIVHARPGQRAARNIGGGRLKDHARLADSSLGRRPRRCWS